MTKFKKSIREFKNLNNISKISIYLLLSEVISRFVSILLWSGTQRYACGRSLLISYTICQKNTILFFEQKSAIKATNWLTSFLREFLFAWMYSIQRRYILHRIFPNNFVNIKRPEYFVKKMKNSQPVVLIMRRHGGQPSNTTRQLENDDGSFTK